MATTKVDKQDKVVDLLTQILDVLVLLRSEIKDTKPVKEIS
jgi:hypothetical protein